MSNVSVKIKCQNCKKQYTAEIPSAEGINTYTVYCPSCSAPHNVTVRKNAPKAKAAPFSGPDTVARKIRRMELSSNIAWLVIGVIQCFTVYAAAAGVWNIINSIIALRNVKNITVGNAAVVPYFEQRKIWLIILAVVNIVLGGVVGVVLVLFEWYIRDYALKNRAVFEG